jgi:hypothetical protein
MRGTKLGGIFIYNETCKTDFNTFTAVSHKWVTTSAHEALNNFPQNTDVCEKLVYCMEDKQRL